MMGCDNLPRRDNGSPVHRLIGVFLLAMIVAACGLYAQAPCATCPLPCVARDSVMDVTFTDGTMISNVRSVQRTTISLFGAEEQGIRLAYWQGARCRDTVVPAGSLVSLTIGGLGGGRAPYSIPVHPAREYYRVNEITVPHSFLEITAYGGYGGSDQSMRKIGFGGFYSGAELLVAPFGTMLGEDLSLAVGGGLLLEGGRSRFPGLGQLRWNFLGGERVVNTIRYLPGDCYFACPDAASEATPPAGFIERSTAGETDRGALMLRDKVLSTSPFRPFLFVEAGTIFDGSFEGAGSDRAINPEDRRPFLAGGGIGATIGDSFTASLGMRFMRLHLLTPCEACENRTVVNANRINSLLLKIGYRLGW